MKSKLALAFDRLALAFICGITSAHGHDLATGEEHPHYDRSIESPAFFLAQALVGRNSQPQTPSRASDRPAQAEAFTLFEPRVKVRWDDRFLFVESNGLPTHGMMVGITAWQQQVPLPQKYKGSNAWQFPLVPVPSKTPVSIKGRFLRGAIALAVNGIPIFNPQNNRGEVSAEIGELDEWGGHCGRADDYHYHTAPLHLQSVVGAGQPIAYALDGYPIYGLTEPDGAAPTGLDAFNGHTTPALGYHYHASKKYPYVNGGFHGEVVERDGQVDPQPRATPVREALPQLRGAKITGFTASPDEKSYALNYWVNGKEAVVKYATPGDGSWKFQFVAADGSTQDHTYRAGERGGGGGQGGPRPEGGQVQRDPGVPTPGGGSLQENRRGGPQAEGRRGAPTAPETVSPFGPDALKKPNGTFVLTSPEVADGGDLPIDYTGDGSGATLPLAWKGAPAGTVGYAVVMDHLAAGNVMKSYWNVWDIPSTVTSLPKNVKGIGKVGISFKGQIGYEPPHSQGPGAKTYVLTVYALSAPLQITQLPSAVGRDVVLAAMEGKVLASSSLHAVYTRGAATSSEQPPGQTRVGGATPPNAGNGQRPPPRPAREGGADTRPASAPLAAAAEPPTPPSAAAQPENQRGPTARGKGGADNKGLIKPTMADTVKVNVYADNWFVLFINGKLRAVDSIEFTPHNVVTVDVLPEYPMTIAIMAKDNADPKTGLEYGDHIGDGGFIIKFSDGTVSNAAWKARNFFRGPLNHDTKNPVVEHIPIPDKWWTTDFDDSQWPNATEFTEQRVNPKEPFYKADFVGAKFIWSDDLDLDNTVIFRTRIEKPGWTPHWNTKPDLDISLAPFQ